MEQDKGKELIDKEITELNTEAENIRGSMDKLNKKIRKLKKKSDLVITSYYYSMHIPRLCMSPNLD